MERMGEYKINFNVNAKGEKVSTTGNLDKIQDVHTPDPNFRQKQNEIALRNKEKSEGPFKSKIEIIMDDLLAKQLKLVELRKNRADKLEIKNLEREIQDIKDSPEYKNTLN